MRAPMPTAKARSAPAIVDGRARKSYGHGKPLEEWEVLLKDHHDGYIDWAEFERNQKQLAANAYGKVGGAKSGAADARCWPAHPAWAVAGGACGELLGAAAGTPVYRCDRPTRCSGWPLLHASWRLPCRRRDRPSFSAPLSRWRSRRRWRPNARYMDEDEQRDRGTRAATGPI